MCDCIHISIPSLIFEVTLYALCIIHLLCITSHYQRWHLHIKINTKRIKDLPHVTRHLYLQAKVVYQVAARLLLCKWSPMSGSLLSSHRWVPPWVFHFWPWIFHSIFLYSSFTDRGGGRRSGASSRFSQWGRHVSPWLCCVSPWLCRVSPCVSQHLLPLTDPDLS